MKDCKSLPFWVIIVWHLALAGVLMAMGSLMVQGDQETNDASQINVSMSIGWPIFLIVIAALAIFYHGGLALMAPASAWKS